MAEQKIKVYVLVTFYDETGLHKAGSVTEIFESEFNPYYMKKITPPSPGESELSELDDVDISDLTDGEVLKYDAANEKWVNSTIGGGIPYVETTSGGTSQQKFLTGSVPGLTAYTDGLSIIAKLDSFGSVSTSLNLNSLGAVPIIFTNNHEVPNKPGNINAPFLMTYENEKFYVMNEDLRGQFFQKYDVSLTTEMDVLYSGASTFKNDTFGYAHRNKDFTFTPSTGTLKATVLEATSFGTNATAAIQTIAGGGGGSSSLVVTLTAAVSGTEIDLGSMNQNATLSLTADKTYAEMKAADEIIFKIVETNMQGYSLKPTGMYTLTGTGTDMQMLFTLNVCPYPGNRFKVFTLEVGPWSNTYTFTCIN